MLLCQRVLSDKRKAVRPRLSQSRSRVELSIRLVQDSDVDVMSAKGKFKATFVYCAPAPEDLTIYTSVFSLGIHASVSGFG